MEQNKKMRRVLPPATIGSQWVHVSNPEEIQNRPQQLGQPQEVVLAVLQVLQHQGNHQTQLLCTT